MTLFLCESCEVSTVPTWNGRCPNCVSIHGLFSEPLDASILVRRIGGRQAAADALQMSRSSINNWFLKGSNARKPQWIALELLRYKCIERGV
jgi:predicted ATP-dependent serine protease